MPDQPCVFCRIISRELPSSVVYEDETVLAFMDIQPATPGHALVVPKRHSPGLEDVNESDGAAMFMAAQRVAAAIRRSTIPCEGVNLFFADGEAALQEVFHAHLHVIPRNPQDGFRIEAKWSEPPRDVLDARAVEVSANLL
ncbi:HIT family protein [Demequina sp. NBRC 110052]|uniref:HIT family protein n=1 Tax=Demequina sp. NBRC 110052 TaxID=1570341 RepID=UPI000A060469|nr:HIT family protein [Demequina sp. NBRC 110052]